jgi:hypothetical protein
MGATRQSTRPVADTEFSCHSLFSLPFLPSPPSLPAWSVFAVAGAGGPPPPQDPSSTLNLLPVSSPRCKLSRNPALPAYPRLLPPFPLTLSSPLFPPPLLLLQSLPHKPTQQPAKLAPTMCCNGAIPLIQMVAPPPRKSANSGSPLPSSCSSSRQGCLLSRSRAGHQKEIRLCQTMINVRGEGWDADLQPSVGASSPRGEEGSWRGREAERGEVERMSWFGSGASMEDVSNRLQRQQMQGEGGDAGGGEAREQQPVQGVVVAPGVRFSEKLWARLGGQLQDGEQQKRREVVEPPPNPTPCPCSSLPRISFPPHPPSTS